MRIDSDRTQKMNLFLTKSHIVLDDSPWKMFYSFEVLIDMFEYLSQHSYFDHFDPDTALKDTVYAKYYMRQG